jgi:hypothetical protein
LRVITNDSLEMTDTKDSRSALHAIAIFEATKGLAALAGLIGVLDLLHRADLLSNTDVHMLVILTSAYIALRFIEAIGLWVGQAWGKYHQRGAE